MSDKTSLGAGKKRTINFNTGSSAQETIVAEGMLKSNLIGKYIFLVPNFTQKSANLVYLLTLELPPLGSFYNLMDKKGG